jgi:hypothetical protein
MIILHLGVAAAVALFGAVAWTVFSVARFVRRILDRARLRARIQQQIAQVPPAAAVALPPPAPRSLFRRLLRR